MIFETPPKDFRPFAFVLKDFPHFPNNKVFYAKLKHKSMINKVIVSWYNDRIEKETVEYLLEDVYDNLNDGTWRKIDMKVLPV